MLARIDKYFVQELQKNGYDDLDFKKLSGIYSESRKHPDIVKKRKKELLEKGKCYRWQEDILEWVEISREDYNEERERLIAVEREKRQAEELQKREELRNKKKEQNAKKRKLAKKKVKKGTP